MPLLFLVQCYMYAQLKTQPETYVATIVLFSIFVLTPTLYVTSTLVSGIVYCNICILSLDPQCRVLFLFYFMDH